jgi:hypothetical protein
MKAVGDNGVHILCLCFWQYAALASFMRSKSHGARCSLSLYTYLEP